MTTRKLTRCLPCLRSKTVVRETKVRPPDFRPLFEARRLHRPMLRNLFLVAPLKTLRRRFRGTKRKRRMFIWGCQYHIEKHPLPPTFGLCVCRFGRFDSRSIRIPLACKKIAVPPSTVNRASVHGTLADDVACCLANEKRQRSGSESSETPDFMGTKSCLCPLW